MPKNNYINVEGHTSLVRDMSTGAVINTSKADFVRYVTQKKLFSERNSQLDEINKHTEEINSLKSDLEEIKGMLIQLMTKNDH